MEEDDPRVAELVGIIREKFDERRRRYPLTEEEFRSLVHRMGFGD